jgi:hypothetical protein
LTNGSGRTNGLVNGSGRGRTNGLTNGSGRGRTNGLTNGSGRGRTNGLTNGLRGRTNGITNGLGRTNGLTNGQGRTNGLTNGLGRTNGLTNGLGRTNGMTNGLRSHRMDNQNGAVAPRKLSTILIVAFIIIMPVSIGLLIQSQPVPGQLINVDGKFKDWNKMTRYVDTAMYSDPVLDITEFSVAVDGTDFFAYIKTQGDLLSRATVDRYFAFIDADGITSTGYATLGLGAEYVVEAYGYNAGSWQVTATKFFGTDQSNWSAFGNIGSGRAESTGTEMEMKASLDLGTGNELDVGGVMRVRFASMTGSTMADVCAPIVDGANGALIIQEAPQDVAGIVATNSLLTLQLRAVGKDVAVNSITISSQGVATTTQVGFAAGTIAMNTAVTVQVTGDITPLANGTLVKASVASAAVTGATYNVNGNGLAAYAKVVPATISIDGAFADWTGIQMTSDAAGDVTNTNIDIIQEAATNQSNNFLAYVRFNAAGKAMSGMAVPSTRVVPTGGGGGGGGGGGTTVLPRVAGEDITRIYIDSVAGGSNIGGISADYMIELKGKNGQITSKNVYTYPAKVLIAGVVAAAAGTGAIETSVAYGLIGNPTGTIRMFVETTDWEKKVDSAAMAHTMMTRSLGALGYGTDGIVGPTPNHEGSVLTCLYYATAPGIGTYAASEWTNAGTATVSTEVTVYAMRDNTNAYFCIVALHDTAANAGDYGVFYFDTGHDGTTSVNSNDIKYEATYGGTWSYNSYSDSGWGTRTLDATMAASVESGNMVYRMSVPLTTLTGGGQFSAGKPIGFAVITHDAADSSKGEWPNSATDTNPSTWGNLNYVPEFPTIAIPIIFCVIPFVVFRAKRRPRHG